MSGESDIHRYIDAAAASSNRGRGVVLALITASVLSFTAYLNSRRGGWFNTRYNLARIAADACGSGWSPQEKAKFSPQDQELYDQSRDFARARGLDANCGQLKVLAQDLQLIQSRDVALIRVPFFGVVFDVNDLGWISGLAFFVLLLWLRFSLTAELRNVQTVFKVAKEQGQLRAAYLLLAMRQVLTVPKMSEDERRKFLGKLVMGLYFLPPVVQGLVVINDFRTLSLGSSMSRSDTASVSVADLVFLLIVGYLAVLCLLKSRAIDLTWDTGYKEMQPGESADSLGEKGEGCSRGV